MRSNGARCDSSQGRGRTPATACVASLFALALVIAYGGVAEAHAAAPRNWSPLPGRTLPAVAPPAAPRVAWSSIGTSVRGRPILLASFGASSRRVLYVGGIHGDEYGADVAEAFAAFLAAHPAAVPAGTRIDVIACLDPDGRAAGTRGNARGVDLNRNLPSTNWRSLVDRGCTAGTGPGSEPETKALVGRLGQGYAAVVALHSTGPLLDYDGPGSYALARRMAIASGFRLTKLPAYTGSLGSYVPERFGAPVVTVELASRSLTRGVLAGLLVGAR